MLNKSKMLKTLSLTIAVIAFVLIGGSLTETSAQRDPFEKRGGSTKSSNPNPNPNPNPTTSSTSTSGNPIKVKPEKVAPAPVAPPTIEQRIDYYKRQREVAAMNGEEIPKVTSVLTLNEMSVTGIFKTPRGFAAMVEATPIKLSYTIYPGEKFFDGQLVAIEENRLVFRKVIKMSDGKFIASVENKPLREYSLQETIQGTAPVTPSGTPEAAVNTPPATSEDGNPEPVKIPVVISPLDEMEKQPVEKKEDSVKEKSKKGGKKPSKVAKKN